MLFGGVVNAIQVGKSTSIKPPPTAEHLRTLAQAVVVVGISGAEVGFVQDKAAVWPCGAAVIPQEEPVQLPFIAQTECTILSIGPVAIPVLKLHPQAVGSLAGQDVNPFIS